jgi:hypothetical protein
LFLEKTEKGDENRNWVVIACLFLDHHCIKRRLQLHSLLNSCLSLIQAFLI